MLCRCPRLRARGTASSRSPGNHYTPDASVLRHCGCYFESQSKNDLPAAPTSAPMDALINFSPLRDRNVDVS